ncbi:MAG: hypothetical protein H0T80_09000 [Betaproteobacteria bacterium]|nr:hypothetical protein [Betaproteobacteria bacterium]
MKQEVALTEKIDRLERRLALRRHYTLAHVHDTKSAFSSGTTWLPLLAVLAVISAAVIGYQLVNRNRFSSRRTRTVKRIAGGAGLLATLGPLVAAAARFGISPQGRLLWGYLRPLIRRAPPSGTSPERSP